MRIKTLNNPLYTNNKKSHTPLHFKAFQKHFSDPRFIDEYEGRRQEKYVFDKRNQPLTLGAKVPIAQFLSDTWTVGDRVQQDPENNLERSQSHVYRIQFTTGTDFFRPESIGAYGAFRLSQMLDTNIIPESVIAKFPIHHKITVGTLCSGIEGTSLADWEKDKTLEMRRKAFHQLISENNLQGNLEDLYLYAVVSNDTDVRDANVFIENNTHHLYLIDPERAGRSILNKRTFDFPKLASLYLSSSHRITDNGLAKLTNFVNHENQYKKELLHYFSLASVTQMFVMANYLLHNQKMIPQERYPWEKLRASVSSKLKQNNA